MLLKRYKGKVVNSRQISNPWFLAFSDAQPIWIVANYKLVTRTGKLASKLPEVKEKVST